MSRAAERYRVDLAALQAACAANYARLMRLLPGMREQAQRREVALGAGEAVLVLQVSAAGPYTSSVELHERRVLDWLPAPRLLVRVYHDARLAEVVGADHCRRLQARYAYPNAAMHQPDEKTQLNLFLGEWLAHYQSVGYLAEATPGWSPAA